MPRGAQRRSTISARQRVVLESLSRRHGTGQQVALRARLVLATVAQSGTAVAAAYGVDRDTVGLWRARWAAAQERLATLEAEDAPERALRTAAYLDAARCATSRYAAHLHGAAGDWDRQAGLYAAGGGGLPV